jgi:hypothetical protein
MPPGHHYNHPKKADLSVLLEDNPEAYYWMGFFLADGSFGRMSAEGPHCLSVYLSDKDSGHLMAFKRFIRRDDWNEAPRRDKRGFIAVSAYDALMVPRIARKFGISHRITYNPTFPLDAPDDLFTSSVIGFIDGDGAVSVAGQTRYQISIALHRNWEHTLGAISERVCTACGVKTASVFLVAGGPYARDGQQSARVIWSNSIILRHLKRKAEEFQLPCMGRKWNLINAAASNRNIEAKDAEMTVADLIKRGLSQAQICRQTGMKAGRVQAIVERIGIEYSSRRTSCRDSISGRFALAPG